MTERKKKSFQNTLMSKYFTVGNRRTEPLSEKLICLFFYKEVLNIRRCTFNITVLNLECNANCGIHMDPLQVEKHN